jgi:hypothetical protein
MKLDAMITLFLDKTVPCRRLRVSTEIFQQMSNQTALVIIQEDRWAIAEIPTTTEVTITTIQTLTTILMTIVEATCVVVDEEIEVASMTEVVEEAEATVEASKTVVEEIEVEE